jgi:hypothetical protein
MMNWGNVGRSRCSLFSDTIPAFHWGGKLKKIIKNISHYKQPPVRKSNAGSPECDVKCCSFYRNIP